MTDDAGTEADASPATQSGSHPLARASAWMAAGTALSRLTGLLRIFALTYALGSHHLATAFNLANTTPNMLYTIVLGGVLSATFIPVFVDRLAQRSQREAWKAISAVVTLSTTVLVAMTVVFWVLAPLVIRVFTSNGPEQDVATTLLRWFVPQVALYGIIAIATALLNTRRRFIAPMWVSIANNVLCIAVLLWFRHVLDTATPSIAEVQHHSPQLVLLGLGTTLGVALQAVLLFLAMRGAGLGRLRWRWDPGHEAVRAVLRLGGWTFGFVVANQVCLFVVLHLAAHATGTAAGTDPVSSYNYAYAFMQVPYAIVAVSVMSAVTPDLAERWSTHDLVAFRRRLAGGLRAILAIIAPAAIGMLLLARPAAAQLAHGFTVPSETVATGQALSMFSLGLPGFCTYLYVVRVLQSMQRTRVALWLYLFENAVQVGLALALVHPLGVRGLALALSVGYTVGAIAGLVVVRRWLGTLGGAETWRPLRRVALATLVMAGCVLVVSNLFSNDLARVLVGACVGVAVYLGSAALLVRLQARPGDRLGAPR